MHLKNTGLDPIVIPYPRTLFAFSDNGTVRIPTTPFLSLSPLNCYYSPVLLIPPPTHNHHNHHHHRPQPTHCRCRCRCRCPCVVHAPCLVNYRYCRCRRCCCCCWCCCCHTPLHRSTLLGFLAPLSARPRLAARFGVNPPSPPGIGLGFGLGLHRAHLHTATSRRSNASQSGFPSEDFLSCERRRRQHHSLRLHNEEDRFTDVQHTELLRRAVWHGARRCE